MRATGKMTQGIREVQNCKNTLNPINMNTLKTSPRSHALHINIFTLSILIGFALILLWFGQQRYSDYLNINQTEAKNAANIASIEIERAIHERLKLVKIYAEDHVTDFMRLAQNPQDESLYRKLNKNLKRYFSDYFTMNIATMEGDPIIDDFDGRLGAICIAEMKRFAKSHKRLIRVHPNQYLYHYDIVIKLKTEGSRQLLFFSFGLDELSRLLGLIQPDNHQLLLVSNDDASLIEVTNSGSRDKISNRVDYRLNLEEKDRILASAKIADTSWKAIDLVDPGVFKGYRDSLLREGIGIYLAFFAITMIMRYYLSQEEERRATAEEKLYLRNQEVEELNTDLLRANEQLKHTALTDSLTGLHNRRCFDNRMEMEVNRAMRSGQTLSLLMFDIDYFKQYNDIYGHQKGDECLKQIADLTTACFRRAEDFVARYGGEEFVVIMSGFDLQHARQVTKQFMEAIAQKKIEHKGSKTSEYVTISAGLVSINPRKKDSPSTILKQADELLYEAKSMGRNQIRPA
jgi:diguanylate cyclase (GGDEF)-like protein